MFSGAMALIFLYILSSVASQSDWSSGPGVFGPVSEWSSAFYYTDGNVYYSSGDLELINIAAEPEERSLPTCQDYVSPADIDGDGDMDLLGVYAKSTRLEWWENVDGTGESWTGHVVDTAFPESHCVDAGDLDGDGDLDVISASSSWHVISCWENVDGIGTLWTEMVIKENYPGASCVTSGDIDGDGDVDVVASDDYYVCWWENSDTSPEICWSAEHVVDHTFSRPHWVSLADVDGDGDTDILGVSRSSSGVAWWANVDGSGTVWQRYPVDVDFQSGYFISSSDIDGDGDTDILASSRLSASGVAWWENEDGTGTEWIKHQLALGTWGGVLSSDFDNDGDNDIIAGSRTWHQIIIWENRNGLGTELLKHIVDYSYAEVSCVQCADMDGNGCIDPVGASTASISTPPVTWWSILGYYSGFIESSVLDLDRSPEWDFLTWESSEPAGTSVGVQLRSSDDISGLGSWSETLYQSGSSLEGLLDDSTRFLQYRLVLNSDEDHLLTPQVFSLSVFYSELITIDEPDQYTVWTHGNVNQLIAWHYDIDCRTVQGDSVSIDLYRSDSLIANLSDGFVPNTGQFTYIGPVPVGWEAGLDYSVLITDELDNYGESDLFEVRQGAGIQGEQGATLLLPVSPNPVYGSARLDYVLSECGEVEIAVLDLAGRVVRSMSSTKTSGRHSMDLGRLSSGIYFCRMTADGYEGSRMFVVLGGAGQ